LTRKTVIEKTVALLRRAGIEENHLRSGPVKKLLRLAGICLSGCRAILDFYRPFQEPHEASQDDEPEGWLDRMTEHLCSTGITSKEEAEVAVASIWKAHIVEEQLLSGTVRDLKKLLHIDGVSKNAKRAIIELYQGPDDQST